MTALGVVVTPTKPAFPNKPLILGGSLGMGLGVGLFLALLVELLSRRVRGIEDLDGSLDVPCLAVVASARPKQRSLLGAIGWPTRPAASPA
jgi:polysaccharide biosynthesis transport protein